MIIYLFVHGSLIEWLLHLDLLCLIIRLDLNSDNLLLIGIPNSIESFDQIFTCGCLHLYAAHMHHQSQHGSGDSDQLPSDSSATIRSDYLFGLDSIPISTVSSWFICTGNLKFHLTHDFRLFIMQLFICITAHIWTVISIQYLQTQDLKYLEFQRGRGCWDMVEYSSLWYDNPIGLILSS